MKCKNCGQELPNYIRFCTNCGCPIDNTEKNMSNTAYVNEQNNTTSYQRVQPKIEKKEKGKKTWLWVLLALLIVCGIGWYIYTYSIQKLSLSENHVDDKTISESIGESISDSKVAGSGNEEMRAFVKEFYLHYLDESYLLDNVSEGVIRQLRRDYPYECDESDCLATWVFSAYPSGTDMELEEGPIIKGNKSPFLVSYKYSYMVDGQKYYEDRSILLWLDKDEGRYKVSSYNYDDKTRAPRYDEDKRINEIPEGNYHLTSADMHVLLNVHNSVVEGEYYFQSRSSLSTSVKLYGNADNGLQLHLRQWNAVNEKNLGYMDGTFDGKTFKGEYDKEGHRQKFEVYYNEWR